MTNDSKNESEITCEICGAVHAISSCTFLEIVHHVTDKEIPSKAKLTLPDILRLEKMASGSYDVLTKQDIRSGTQFGPFEAKQTFTLNPEIIFPLKVFAPNDYFTEYFLDTCNESECNWMMFVQPAFNGDEQNMICYQRDNKLYYITICDIKSGVPLKVWYGPRYAKLMNKELLKPTSTKDTEEYDLNSLLKKQQNLIQTDIWNCKFCDFHETNITKFAGHISEHYSAQLKKVCKWCKATFSTHMALKKHLHIVHVHTPVQKKQFEDKASNNNKNVVKDSMLGGPLLNEILTDSMDNTNLLLQESELTQFDIQNIENQNMLLDSDSLNLGMDNLIEDNDNFNFDINDDKEEHVCDICMKPFNKLKQLIQHLQMHTGKYTCPQCLIIFSRNENLKAHKCNLTQEMQQKCPFCDKLFPLKKYLSRHILVMHGKKYQCEKCKKVCTSEKVLLDHACSGNSLGIDKDKYSCMLCNKKFARESYMKKHLKTHSTKKDSQPKKQGEFICDVCAKTFDTLRNLRRHMIFHFVKENYACSQCDKTFTRRDTLNTHISVCHSSEVFTCDICLKKCKSKKYLSNHKLVHKKTKRFDCDLCNQKFFLKSNLERHKRSKHLNAVVLNDKKQINIEFYKCPFCLKTVKLRSSLLRHLKRYHGNESFDPKNIVKDVTTVDIKSNKIKKAAPPVQIQDVNCNNRDQNKIGIGYNNSNANQISINYLNDPNKDTSNTLQIKELNQDFTEIAQEFNTFQKPEAPETAAINKPAHEIVDFNNIDLDLESGLDMPQDLNVNNQEVCLSMPDLSDIDQNITLGDNAFILDNGTIVEPLDQGNFVVYILGQQLP